MSISDIVLNNPFAERILYLLSNPELSKRPVENLHQQFSAPNCIGTALFVTGVSMFSYPHHGYEDELREHMRGDKTVRRIYSSYLSNHLERRVPGAFIFSYCVESDGWHCGVYLGEVDEKHLSFAQHGHKGPFQVEEIDKYYTNPKYYIPSTLL